jgi:hypothetical protein
VVAGFVIYNSITTQAVSPATEVQGVQDWTHPIVCHFTINDDDVEFGGDDINGPLFNITSSRSIFTKVYSLSRATTTSLTSITTSSTPISSITPTSAVNQSTSSSNNKNGLSAGARAGTAIGTVAGCIVLAVLALTIWRYKRRLDKLQSGHSNVHGEGVIQTDVYQHQAAAELEPQVMAELELQAMAELESRDVPQELHGSNVVIGQPRPRGV